VVNNTVLQELDRVADQIRRAYVLGNKSDARILFKSLPEHRKAYVAMQMTIDAYEDGSVSAGSDLVTFIRSITE